MTNQQPTFTLHDGTFLPKLGLGTYRMKTMKELRPVVKEAIRTGYRLIDSASVYRNEKGLGNIIREILQDESFGVQRKDLFITSKLAPKDQGYDACYNAVISSLEKFELEYLDLYLIHWPGTSKLKLDNPKNQENRTRSYQALEQLYKEGKIRQIGISNYTIGHLQHLIDTCTVLPHVHQFELHPGLYQKDLISLCEKNHIQVQAYSSLGEGKLVNGKVDIEGLDQISERLNVTKAQVLLRWAIQHGWAVIPKSTSPERVKVNGDIFSFDLTDQDMNLLDDYHTSKGKRFCWDPTNIY
ncbi:NADP-dependent oxidoreductase domain-containing protein [Spinellus fusiger]|nr:NADP-dependent oxidoreductase domain-containing protein [Spinellus fusiger]